MQATNLLALVLAQARSTIAIPLGGAESQVSALAPFCKPLSAHLQAGGMALLTGGVTYTASVPFYRWRKLPHHHTLWHVFVLTGSVLHFLAVLLYVLPGGVGEWAVRIDITAFELL